MSRFVHRIDGSGPREDAPIPDDRVASGDPHTVTAIDYSPNEKVYAGEWSATTGAWSVKYDEWEFCHILEGVCELVTSDGVARRFKAGDSFVIEPGFVGMWRVIEPMKKRFVIRYD